MVTNLKVLFFAGHFATKQKQRLKFKPMTNNVQRQVGWDWRCCGHWWQKA